MPKSSLIYLENFSSGIFTNRSPLTTPKVSMGINIVSRPETLIDGSNVEISPRNTIIRRPGFPTFNATAFASGEWPLAFWSGRLSSTLYDLVDTQTNIYSFSSSALTSIFSKTGTAKSFFQQSGNYLYFADGTTNKKWDGTTVTNAGLPTPASAPAIANLNLHDTGGATQTVHAWSPNYSYVGPASGTNTLWLQDPNGNIQIAFVQAGQTAVSGSSSPNWSTEGDGRTLDGDLTWTNAGPLTDWLANQAYAVDSFNPGTVQNLFSGPLGPTAYAQTGGGSSWSGTLPGTLTNVIPTSGTSKLIAFTGFGFALPSGAVPTGVVVSFTRGSKDNINTFSDNTVKLLKASSAAGNNKAASGFYPESITTTSYGSATDLWGTTVSQSDANDSGFGVELQVDSADNHTLSLYSVSITIYYTVSTIAGTFSSTIVKDSNGNLQRVKTAGTSDSSVPTWSTTIGGTTTDNTVTWECMGSSNVLAAFVGWKWAYSFHAPTPHTSTLSPAVSLQAPIIGTGVTLTGLGSSDTQVDRNDLYRTVDGGALFLYDASANNVDGSTSWSIVDNLQDVQLNATIVGPIAHANDAPPAGITCTTWYMGRLWGAVGNLLYFTAGPDCTNGNKDECWPPANVFPFPSDVVALAPSSMGLVVVLSDQTWAVLGGPQTLTFFTQPILQKLGVLNSDCVAQDGDTLYLYTSGRQLLQISSDGKTEIGFSIADVLKANYDPTKSSLDIHRNGPDEGLFISNGVSRINRFSLVGGAWSPSGTIAAGIGLVKSLETSAGVYSLIAGPPAGAANLLIRNLASFLDVATGYSAYATVGSLVLSPPGESGLAVKSVTLQYLNVGTDLTVSVLPNEVSGSFTSVPFTAVDPWPMVQSTSIKGRRHDWLGIQSVLPNVVKHVQIKVGLATENIANELLAVGIVSNV